MKLLVIMVQGLGKDVEIIIVDSDSMDDTEIIADR